MPIIRHRKVPEVEKEKAKEPGPSPKTSGLTPKKTGQNPVSVLERASELTIRELDESMRADDEVNLAASADTNNLEFNRVKAGRRLVLTHLSGYNDTSACTIIRVGYWNGHRLNWLKSVVTPLIAETVEFDGKIYLRELMYPIVRFEGCSEGDDLYASLNGYWLKK